MSSTNDLVTLDTAPSSPVYRVQHVESHYFAVLVDTASPLSSPLKVPMDTLKAPTAEQLNRMASTYRAIWSALQPGDAFGYQGHGWVVLSQPSPRPGSFIGLRIGCERLEIHICDRDSCEPVIPRLSNAGIS